MKARIASPPRPKKVQPIPTINKPASERLAKTVLPNVMRTTAPEATGPASANGRPASETTPSRSSVMSSPREEPASSLRSDTSARRSVLPSDSTGIATEVAVAPPPPRNIAMAPPATAELPPAIAVALAPQIERGLSLPLGDLIPGIPHGYLKSSGLDANRRVLLKAAE